MIVEFDTTLATAKQLDAQDELAHFKQQFHFPIHNDKPVIYFCGNSLGLQPVNVEAAVLQELSDWKNLAISGFSKAKNPWLVYQEYLKPSLANIVGCKESEVTVMNTLTVNLHLLMLTFYKPTKQRFKIMMEAGAFPSDQYAVETLAKHYNLQPDDVIIEISPRAGEKLLHTEDIITAINNNAESLAMVMFGGINYYTGQLFDMQQITKAAHAAGAIAGFDLAHVVGNVPLQLHNWHVDFACWCSYKYLNGGPGAVGGIYIHEQYAENPDTPRLAGWWGNDEATRFKMEKGFVAKPNASGWNISTAQVLNTVALKASLEMFDAAGIEKLRSKSLRLTAYLAYLLHQLHNIQFEIITPANPNERGVQLSLYFVENGKAIHQKMMDSGIVVDFREPGVIRVAPAPMYCGFEDVYRFYELLRDNF
ncbi:MAG: kynureninase [Deinococcales bacterium]|nr:kynureninase [Chitinophagaceae bacterium]